MENKSLFIKALGLLSIMATIYCLNMIIVGLYALFSKDFSDNEQSRLFNLINNTNDTFSFFWMALILLTNEKNESEKKGQLIIVNFCKNKSSHTTPAVKPLFITISPLQIGLKQF